MGPWGIPQVSGATERPPEGISEKVLFKSKSNCQTGLAGYFNEGRTLLVSVSEGNYTTTVDVLMTPKAQNYFCFSALQPTLKPSPLPQLSATPLFFSAKLICVRKAPRSNHRCF